MEDFIMFFHGDNTPGGGSDIGPYIEKLRKAGKFAGGSAMGGGACFRKKGRPGPLSSHIGGFIRVQARDLEEAEQLLEGNPIYESGGTVEIRWLPKT